MGILVETSARHVHLCKEHIEILFGEGYALTVKKELSQPGQFACEERVDIIGPKKELKNVSILGPARKDTQVEISATDARTLGVPIVVKESGDIEDTPGCTIIGPKGRITIEKGVIVAKRHIHLTPKVAEELGVKDKQIVCVKINGTGRDLVFGDVVIRVRSDFAPAMHIDTDESNAGLIAPGTIGEILI
jgi:propanediol utilization protein